MLQVRGITQAELARRSGLTTSEISRVVLRRRPTPRRTVLLISSVLELPPEDIGLEGTARFDSDLELKLAATRELLRLSEARVAALEAEVAEFEPRARALMRALDAVEAKVALARGILAEPPPPLEASDACVSDPSRRRT